MPLRQHNPGVSPAIFNGDLIQQKHDGGCAFRNTQIIDNCKQKNRYLKERFMEEE
jgi:hypothetical protein